MEQINLSAQQKDEWALFLPALSSFYISGLGKQEVEGNYFPPGRIPAGIQNTNSLNFLDDTKGIFSYKWILYSAGHADLLTYKNNPNEHIVVSRDRKNTFMLADSGGFQILKCQWPADWKDPNCPRAMKKRQEVLRWMDDNADYGMCLDIPSQSLTTYHILDKKTGKSAHGISTIEEAITATHINNEYFVANRDGRCKFLNVLQGRNHKQSDDWYEEMKKYCDTNIYGDRAFNGWAFGGQNKIDVELMLKRLVHIIHDGFLEEGKHDLIHCLGTSILEYAILFTDIQKAIRKYHNPKLRITFDCASPFFGAAKGLAYNYIGLEHDKKWTYSMEKTAENKNYDTDTRKLSDALLADGIHERFADSPITDRMIMKDLCYRGHGMLGQHGKETKTSWDTLSYTLIQGHNVYQHIYAVQEGNRRYEKGVKPSMVLDKHDHTTFGEIVDEIFSLKDRQKSIDLINKYSLFWTQMKAGQGFSGRKTINAHTKYEELFEGDTSTVTAKPEPKKVEELISAFDNLFDIN